MEDGPNLSSPMFFNKKHYFTLSGDVRPRPGRIWTRRRRHVAAELGYMAFWLLLAVAILATVPWLKYAGAEFTTNVVSTSSSDF